MVLSKREGLLCVCVGGAGAGLTDGPIQRVGGGPRAREGGGPIPGIEAATVDLGGHLLLAANSLAPVFGSQTITGLCCSVQGQEEGGEVEKEVKDASEELQQRQEVS